MTEESAPEILEGIHQSIKDHLNQGNQRIKAWYLEGYSHPDDPPEIEEPPHQRMMEQSAEFVNFAARSISKGQVEMNGPRNSVELLVYGVATELLLSSIHLKLDPTSFIKHLENQGETPSYDQCSDVLFEDLSDKIPQEQMRIMVKVLDIIRDQRNNEAHLGYHTFNHSHLDGLILEAVYILGRIYSESEITELGSLRETIDDVRGSEFTNPRRVEFDIDAIFESRV